MTKSDLELVRRFVPRVVDARCLARRSDELARKQVRKRRMIVEVADEARQEIRSTQERTVRRSRPAERDVRAAARADLAPIEREFFRSEPCLARFFVEHLGGVGELRP